MTAAQSTGLGLQDPFENSEKRLGSLEQNSTDPAKPFGPRFRMEDRSVGDTVRPFPSREDRGWNPLLW